MDGKPDEPDKHTFIVRFWYEPDTTERGHWRGMVEQVQTQQRRYFTSFDEMNQFMSGFMPDDLNRPTEQT